MKRSVRNVRYQIGLLVVLALRVGVALAATSHVAPPALKRLSDSSFWTFERFWGDGHMTAHRNADGDVLELWSDTSEGMAASVRSQKFPVEPNRRYIVTLEVKTENLQRVDAHLTAGPYILFWDRQLLPGSYQPPFAGLRPGHSARQSPIADLTDIGPGRSPEIELLAPQDSDWHTVSRTVTAPTTARSAELFLAYAAYGGHTEGLSPRVSGRAHGRAWIRNVHIAPDERVTPLQPTIQVSDPAIQPAVDTVFDCLHNASVTGIFRLSDGYTYSKTTVPDLSFGLYGVRRQGHREYMDIMRRQWEALSVEAEPDGKLPQRVMDHILFPIAVDEIFSFTGDLDFLAKQLPVADRALEYVNRHADQNGLVRLVDYGQWVIGQGADWVDWYPTRMEGKTFNFHQWYVRALRRAAALHDEFSKKGCSWASADRAREYRSRADQVEQSLRHLYWSGDHFVTNVDYGGKVADEKWLDDQVWAIKFGIATPEQRREIWSWIDAKPLEYEGVPTTWAAFPGPHLGPLSWFGRLGAGDILARYASGNPNRGMELLKRISEIFARDENVYEAYTMYGTIAIGTYGWGNYLEAIGGYIWALIGGPFGLDFDSDGEAVATLRPHFPEDWTRARTEVWLRGARVNIEFSGGEGNRTLTLRGEEGPPEPIRLISPNGAARIVHVGAGIRLTSSL